MARKRKKSRRRRRYSRNPYGFTTKGLQSQLGDAAALAAGLVGVGLVSNLLPLPAVLRSGFVRHFTKGAVAVALGSLAGMSKLISKSNANLIALGGLASVVVDIVNDVTAQTGLALPSPAGAGMTHYTGVPGLGSFPAYESGMEAYTGVEASSGMGMYGSYY